MNVHARFGFARASLPSLADALKQARTDARIPEQRRASVVSSLSKLAEWSGQDGSTIAFVEPVIEALFGRLRADVLSISKKRLKNARADVRFVLALYGGQARYFTPFTPQAQRLRDMLRTKYEQCSLSRLLRFLSAHCIDPTQMDEATSQAFLDALRRENRLKIKPEVFHQSTVRAWNRAIGVYPDWPRVVLAEPKYNQSWTRSWWEFGATLEQEIDRFLAVASEPSSLFDEQAPIAALRPRTRKTQKQHFRCVASALARAGVPPKQLVSIRCLCTPDRIRTAIRWIVKEKRGGHVGGYVEGVMWTLVRAARSPGMLSAKETDEVNKLCADLTARRKAERRTHKDRDQKTLAQMDDPKVMDAFLALPARTAARVLKSSKRSSAKALEIQCALALELWLCAPLRLANFVRIRLDENFYRIWLDGRERIVIRVPAEHVKNLQAVEHLLNEDTQELLELYVRDHRRLLISGPSPWLFPGRQGNHKADAAFSSQMRRFVNRAVGIDFHPHLIRKIVAKLHLDTAPGEIEIVRRLLGHTSAHMTRAYTQHQQRAAQQRYLSILEDRRLMAMRRGL
jgi:integrase